MESLLLLSHTPPAKKSYWFYLENLSRIQPLLSSSTAVILVQAIILLPCKSLLFGVISTPSYVTLHYLSQLPFLLVTPLWPICSSLNRPNLLVPQRLCNDCPSVPDAFL